MVGATGFEPATSCSRSRRATGLRYAPPNSRVTERLVNAPVGTRTPNLLIRSQMLYPVELWALRYDAHRGRRRPNADTNNRPRARSVNLTAASTAHDASRTLEKKSPRHSAGGNGMGGTRLELVTSTMSTWRSNQLS